MVDLSAILAPTRISLDVSATSKKGVVEELSRLIASDMPRMTPAGVFDSLIARERLGSTAIGKGIAIPHGRLNHLERPVAAFVRTRVGIDYDAVDDQPADLFFALAVPEEATEEHLEILASLARRFSDAGLVEQIRQQDSPEGVRDILCTEEESQGSP